MSRKFDKLNILLMVPPRNKSSVFLRDQYFPPIGLAYLAAYARKRAEEDGIPIRFKILDASIEGLRPSGLKRLLGDQKPDIVGLNFYTENRFDAFKAIQDIKEHSPDILIVVGGPHATLAADDTIRNFRGVDYLVRGEGEVTFYALLKTIFENEALNRVEGLSYRTKKQIVHNPDRPFLKDLDSIPLPAWDLLKMNRYFGSLDWYQTREKMGMLFTSRGCPFPCNFCSSSKAWGKRYRLRSPEGITDEIKLLKAKYGISAFIFFDDTMTVNRKSAMRVCEKIIAEGLEIRWQTHSRIDAMDEELMSAMKQAGCVGIMFGVESGSQRILDEVVRKKITVHQVAAVSELSNRLGMTNNFSYIVSHPSETWADAELTMKMIERHLKDRQTTVLNIMRCYPGTGIEEYAVKNHLLPKDFSWSREMDYESGIVSRTLKGNVPFFRDLLTWEQIFTINARYLKLVKYPAHKHAWDALKNIRSPRDIGDLARLGFIHFKTWLAS